jgi:hypothetical protein
VAVRWQSYVTAWAGQARASEEVNGQQMLSLGWKGWVEKGVERIGDPFSHSEGSRIALDEIGTYLVSAELPTWVRIRPLHDLGQPSQLAFGATGPPVLMLRWDTEVSLAFGGDAPANMPFLGQIIALRQQRWVIPFADYPERSLSAQVEQIPFWLIGGFARRERIFGAFAVTEEMLPPVPSLMASMFSEYEMPNQNRITGGDYVGVSDEQMKRIVIGAGNNHTLYLNAGTGVEWSGVVTEQMAIDSTFHYDQTPPSPWDASEASVIDICKISDLAGHLNPAIGWGGSGV